MRELVFGSTNIFNAIIGVLALTMNFDMINMYIVLSALITLIFMIVKTKGIVIENTQFS